MTKSSPIAPERPLRVMLVDDGARHIRLIREELTRLGHEVVGVVPREEVHELHRGVEGVFQFVQVEEVFVCESAEVVEFEVEILSPCFLTVAQSAGFTRSTPPKPSFTSIWQNSS